MWASPELFKIDAAGNPVSVAGTPPDQFSATGQYWGNPIYDWDAMEADGFSWWEGRIRAALNMYDVIRLDHFRGFEAYWEVPFSSPDSSYGSWTQGPGLKFFKTLEKSSARCLLSPRTWASLPPASSICATPRASPA